MFFNTKDKVKPLKKSGVYKLTCNECDNCYVGQTGRDFETRFKEHQSSFKLNKHNSNFANHFIETKHKFPDISNLKILHTVPKSKKLDILESIEIYKHNKNINVSLLNEQLELRNSPLYDVL